jgi:aminopeptidase N
MFRVACGLLLLIGAALVDAAPPSTVWLDFAVAIDPAARTLHGEGILEVPPGPAARIRLDRRFTATDMQSSGTPLPRASDDSAAWVLPAAESPRRIAVRWAGTLDRLDPALDHRDTLAALAPVTGPEGTFLPAGANWYPNVEGLLEAWRITLTLPVGQRGLVPGRLLEERDDSRGYRATFEFAHAGEGIDLMAGPYTVTERTVSLGDRSVRLRTYFAPGLENLPDGYLASTAEYLRLYDTRIGPYPYTEFSIVSSPTPTGFGMPTLTYLGADVLKLPFIRATSLGHEVLHNWWGNGVYPDYGSGNWSEGLTTFMADYHYKERESAIAARDMRLAWLRDYAAVPEGQDQPLATFTARTHGTSQIVGYHKAAMTFSMLRDLIGEQAFDRGLREFWSAHRFTVASWDDLRAAFEQASSQDLGGFFSQWIARPGAPRLHIRNAERQAVADRWQVRVTLAQDGQPYRLRVPIRIETDQGTVEQSVDLAAAQATATLMLDSPPHAVVLDPELRLFRRLGPEEAPPILRDVMINPATGAIFLSADDAWVSAATGLLAKLLDGTPRIVDAGSGSTGAPLVVIGTAAEIERYRAGRNLAAPPPVPTSGTARVWIERVEGSVALFIAARDPTALSALNRPLPHYGKQSWLTFEGAKALERGVWSPAAARWPLD